VICLTFDLAGHGGSGGDIERLSAADHLDDAIAAFDHLVASGADAARMGVCGASYGAYLAAVLTSRRAVSRLLMRAPALYDDDDLALPVSLRRRSSSDVQADKVFEAVRHLGNAVLVVESGRDEVIPHGVIDAYLDACPEALHAVLPDATHSLRDPAWNETFIRLIVDWFAKL
jgi:dienelactone hydrolase